MAKALNRALAIRNGLRNQVHSSIINNKVLKLSLANKPIRGNFRTMLSLYPKDPIFRQQMIDKYEEIPNQKQKTEEIDPVIMQSLENIKDNTESLKVLIKNLTAQVTALKGKS